MNTEINYRNCYIKKFPLHYTDDDLKDLFLKYGTPISCKVERDETGKSKGFGYCSFATHEEAARAVRNLNGLSFNGKQIVCEPFLPREIHERTERIPQCRNLYVGNIDETVTKEELSEIFSQFGDIESAIVMRDNNGRSKKYGYVCFKEVEDAEECLLESDNIYIKGKRCLVQLEQNRSNRQLSKVHMQFNMKYDQHNMEDFQTDFQSIRSFLHNQLNMEDNQPNMRRRYPKRRYGRRIRNHL